ncbi:MAG TPA: DUF3307 domain-containing protein [Bacteroidales bacterium]|nr:DUF3307 domain-containing protein [Bacteroidales bacterium]
MDKIFFFTTEQGVVFIQLIMAHIIGDFMLQTNGTADKKKWNNRHILLHISLIFIVNLILTWSWLLAVIVSAAHYIIDGVKPFFKNKTASRTKVFLADQAMHFIVILIAWMIYCNIGITIIENLLNCITNYNQILIITGYLVVIYPAGYLIGFATKSQNKDAGDENKIDSGGKIIGIFERIIILTLVLLNQYEAIGFLITGKSIIRFADKNSPLKSEYVLIGTMMSYAIAILTGVIINYLMQ